MTELTVKIREDGYVSVEEDNDGIKSFKQITPESLTSCIARSMVRDGIASGLLPLGCLSFAILNGGNRRVCLTHQEDYAGVSYYGTAFERFPIPRLVFGFTVNPEGRVTSCDMGVVENAEIMKPSTVMYHYPFSNVSGFRLCTGNNVLPNCESLHTLRSLPYYILSMPNNNDHFQASHNKQGLEMRDLFELLKDKTPGFYYSDVLIPSGASLDRFITGRFDYA